MKLNIIYIFLIISLPFFSKGQMAMDTILLSEVLLKEKKIINYMIGGRIESISPILLGKSNSLLLSEYLFKNGSIYIKQYGALATPSFRGTAATHTLFLWNDIPLNSLSTGLIDVSLLPTNSFNNIQIAYGSSSSAFGSGAVGGSIHLNNTIDFKLINKINITSEIGTYGLHVNQLDLKYANNKYYSSIIFNRLTNDNNFSFINTTKMNSPLEYYNNASIKSDNLQCVFAYKYNKNNILETHFWKLNSFREIPGNMAISNSSAEQYDNAIRLLLKSKHIIGGGKINLKIARMEEDFSYIDELKSIDSKILAESYIANVDYTYYFNQTNLNFGVASTLNNIESNNYRHSPKRESEKSIYASSKIYYKRFAANFSLRKQINSINEIPLIPSFGFKQKLFNNFTILAKTNKSYRTPTFNERFWIGLGNNNLLPENGWNNEVGLDIGSNDLKIRATIFSLKVKDWIQWIPNEGGFWSPENIKQVWSRGLEFNFHFKKKINNIKGLLYINYQYNISTNEKGINKLDNSIGKQLIYTPYHKGNINIVIKDKNFSFLFNQCYNGTVFTLSDNTDNLNDFWLTDLAFLYEFKELPFSIQLKVKNLYNKSYQPYKNYPAPGRTLLFTLNYLMDH